MHIPDKKQLYRFNEGIFINYKQQNVKKKGVGMEKKVKHHESTMYPEK